MVTQKEPLRLTPDPLADAFLAGDKSDEAALAFMKQQDEPVSSLVRRFYPERGRGAIVGPFFYSAEEARAGGFHPSQDAQPGCAYAYLSRAQLLGEVPLRSGNIWSCGSETRAAILEIIDTYDPATQYILVLHDRAANVVGVFGRQLVTEPVQ